MRVSHRSEVGTLDVGCVQLSTGSDIGHRGLLNVDSVWPGAWAMVPTFGAAAFLLARRESPRTASRLAQGVALIFHLSEALAAGSRLGVLRPAAPLGGVTVGLLVSLLLGDLSCRLVEMPSRRWFMGCSRSVG